MTDQKEKTQRYIFVTGGVVSSLGKGLAAAALAADLQANGYTVRIRKLDPYLNVDPGTMSPYQHGECYVTDDGAETDLDLGHYERFTGVSARQSDNITTGRIYSDIIRKERKGEYLGATVQVVPHVTNAIKAFIGTPSQADFVIVELGGTIGDIEGLPFVEAIRQFCNDVGYENALCIHLTLLPYIKAAGELKTKPTQHSVRDLLHLGIQPKILVIRCDREIPDAERRKIALFGNVKAECVIPALDVPTIYQVPIALHEEGLDKEVLKYFGLETKEPDLQCWHDIVEAVNNPEGEVTIGVVGKYMTLLDSYKSLAEALTHGGFANNVKVNFKWIDAEIFEKEDCVIAELEGVDGILVPGGFGTRGIEGKIKAVQFARERKIPYFGICLGLQMAVIEYARNIVGLKGANSTEFGECDDPVVGMMTEWAKGDALEKRSQKGDMGGTMRLGAYDAKLVKGSHVSEIYGVEDISERHRHRYEVNTNYQKQLQDAGLIFSGMSPDGELPEIVELEDHPWFVAVQFHPELKSRPFDPHPLFASFIKAAIKKSRLV